MNRELLGELAIACAEPCDYWHHAVQRALSLGTPMFDEFVWC